MDQVLGHVELFRREIRLAHPPVISDLRNRAAHRFCREIRVRNPETSPRPPANDADIKAGSAIGKLRSAQIPP